MWRAGDGFRPSSSAIMVSFNFGQTIGALNCNRELEARLMIMIGSIKAGNTSRELKRDVRRILDEML